MTIDAPVCACVRLNAYDCWRARYRLPLCASVVDDGGPCQCFCHDDDDTDIEDQP